MRRAAGLLVLAVLTVSLFSCATPRVPSAPAPTYSELAEGYNRRLAGFERLWSRAVVAVRWRDEKDRNRYEQGNDSKLLVQVPDRVALVIGAAGQIAYWAGSDDQRYWVLDLLEERQAYVGLHADSRRALARHDLPVQVSPRALPALLGLLPLPPAEGTPPPVRRVKQSWQVVLPDGRTRLTVDADTLLPQRVELLDDAGQAVVESLLSQPQRMAMHGKPPGAWVTVMTRVELRALAEPFSLSLNLEDMTDAGSPQEQEKAAAFGRSFDYEHLVERAFKIPADRRTRIE